MRFLLERQEMKIQLLTKIILAAAVAATPVAVTAQQYPQSTLEQVRESAERDRGISPLFILVGVAALAVAIFLITQGDDDQDAPVSP